MSDLQHCRVGCLVCKRSLDNIQPNGNQPLRGLEFTSPGHYGSGVFDPMDGTRLVINICDACLTEAALKGHVLLSQPPRPMPADIIDLFNPMEHT